MMRDTDDTVAERDERVWEMSSGDPRTLDTGTVPLRVSGLSVASSGPLESSSALWAVITDQCGHSLKRCLCLAAFIIAPLWSDSKEQNFVNDVTNDVGEE